MRKHLRPRPIKTKRTQKSVKARTETETTGPALDAVISEDEKDRVVREAFERFIRSGIKIRDVYGRTEHREAGNQ